MQGPPDVMPDGFGVIGFAALDQFRNLSPENVGNRAPITPDSIGIALSDQILSTGRHAREKFSY